jgi:hypothetical protein
MKFKSMMHVCCAFASLSVVITIAAHARAQAYPDPNYSYEYSSPVNYSLTTYCPESTDSNYGMCGTTYPDNGDWITYNITGKLTANATATATSKDPGTNLINGVIHGSAPPTGNFGGVTVYLDCSTGGWFECSRSAQGVPNGEPASSTCTASCPRGATASILEVYDLVESYDWGG